MRYPAEETAHKHERILEEAMRLFRERGFAGVGLREVMEASGLTRGPFYNHFASKEALMAGVIDGGMQRTLDQVQGSEASAAGKAAYFDSYLSARHRDAPGAGCFMAALANDVRQGPEVQKAFTPKLRQVVEKFASHFPWRSRRSARGDAIRALSSLVGAMILSRAVDDKAFAREILAEVRRGLE
jgi:TetR/AcrR family transcriptional repressor of nem operon